MKDSIKSRLLAAYADPSEKFAFFTGKNNPRFGHHIGLEQWDWTPQRTINVEPYYWNTHTIPLALGCPIRHTSEAKEWVEPLITHPTGVSGIKIPNPADGRTGEILENINRLVLDIPNDALIRLPDIQSPLGVAELMWHPDNFYIALLTDPMAVHELLEKITEFIILYIREIQAMLGDKYNPACFSEIWSDPVGYYIADDTNSLVSPEMHAEFSITYINCRYINFWTSIIMCHSPHEKRKWVNGTRIEQMKPI